MSGKGFLISIDQGTTGSRVFCFDTSGKVISSAYREFTQHFPQPGWVEHDGDEIWQGVSDLTAEALKKGELSAKDALGIGITNQRETAILWDGQGRPVHRAIVWQCRRTSKRCKELQDAGHADRVRAKTGLVLDAYFSGTKFRWILDHVEGAHERARKGELKAGTIDAWLLYKLTGEFRTEYTNASRTLLYNIEKKEWDDELLDIFGVPRACLPEVCPSGFEFGRTKNAGVLPDGIPVFSMLGDQQAALFGQLCVEPGSAKNTYGTGCFLLLNTGDRFLISRSGLLTTLACDATGDVCYSLEGSVFIGGAVVQWLRDYMNFFSDARDTEDLIADLGDEPDDVVVVPAFAGLGAPHWDMNARGAIFGISRDTTPARITRAALKSIALQSRDLVLAMENDTGERMPSLRVDGGATANGFLMRYQAGILDRPVERPANTDTTVLGATYLAGLRAGVWNMSDLKNMASDTTVFKPNMDPKVRNHELAYWNKAIDRVKGWASGR